MMKLGNETALQLNDCYYLDYIYKSLYVQCYNNDQLVKHMNHTCSISKDYTSVQRIVTAMYNLDKMLLPSPDLAKISRKDLNAAREILNFSLQKRYFPWDIFFCPDIADLAVVIHKTGHFPRSPFALAQDTETKKMQFNLRVLEPLENDDTSKEFKDEMAELAFKVHKILEKAEQLVGENILPEKRAEFEYIKHEYQYLAKLFSGNNRLYSVEKEQAIRRKKLVNPLYKGSRSLWSRVWGLALWELRNVKDENELENAQNAKQAGLPSLSERLCEMSPYCEKISEDSAFYKQVKEKRNLERWYKATVQSIQAAKYIVI